MQVRQTIAFRDWFSGLRDRAAVQHISARIRRMTVGNLGDVKSVGDGVLEARIHYGPGYRLYFVRRNEELLILLCGGDKGSQDRDIAEAKRLANEA